MKNPYMVKNGRHYQRRDWMIPLLRKGADQRALSLSGAPFPVLSTEEAPLQQEASEPLFPQLPEGGHPALPRLGSSHLAEPSWSRPPTPTSFSAAVLLMRSQVFSIFIYVSHKCSCMWRPVSCRLPAYDIPWNHRRACGLLILIDFGWWVTFRKTNVAGHPPCPSRSE